VKYNVGVYLILHLTATPLSTVGRFRQDLLAPRPEESLLFQLLLGSSITHSLLGKLPFRNSGSRVLRTREPYGHSPCNKKPRTPSCDVNGQCLRLRSYPDRDITTARSLLSAPTTRMSKRR
jgi:hypothetical protein